MTTTQYVYTTAQGLYVTDGANGDQTLIKATSAGNQATAGFVPGYQMAALPDGEVVFGGLADSPEGSFEQLVNGVQLWATDGTAGGTTLLTTLLDANAGAPGDTAGLANFVTAGTEVYGEYDNGAGDDYLVATDGTVAGTQTGVIGLDAKSIGAGDGAAIGSNLVFATSAGLYIADGDTDTATLIKATSVGSQATAGFVPGYQMAALPDGEVVFGGLADSPEGSFEQLVNGVQLWVTDGTAGGTTLLTTLLDANAGAPGDTAGLVNFVTAGTEVYGEYDNGVGDDYLVATDGTVAGTHTGVIGLDAKSIGAGEGAAIGSNLVFATSAGLYIADGDTYTATLIKATTAGNDMTPGFLPGYQMAALPDGKVVFGATANSPANSVPQLIDGMQLWVTDGTAAGTTLLMTAPDPNAGAPGDTAGFINFVTDGDKVLFEYNDGNGDYTLYSTDGTAAGTVQIGPVDARSVGAGDGAPCYGKGTLIATVMGEAPVEDLRAGDLVLTASGSRRPIKWIGHRRLFPNRHPRPESVRPVRVSAGALGPGVPVRDLLVSPDHALWWDCGLVAAGELINGATIRQEACAEVTYFHVELDSHDILLAEGAPAESYLDCGNRGGFANAPDAVALHPDWTPLDDPRLFASRTQTARLRERFAERAVALGRAREVAAHAARQALRAQAPRANFVRNARGEGAVVGRIGDDGAAPRFWWCGAPQGVQVEVVGSGVETGLPFVDLRFRGEARESGNASIHPEPRPEIPAERGQDWTLSCHLSRVGGDFMGVSGLNLYFDECLASGDYIDGQSHAVRLPTDEPLALQRIAATHRIRSPSASRITVYVRMKISAGSRIDVTLRVAGLQIEQGAWASDLLLPPEGAPGVARRDATAREDFVIAA